MRCCVPACYYLKNTTSKISLFRPQNKAQLRKWQEVMPTIRVTKDSRVCSRHFLRKDIKKEFPGVVNGINDSPISSSPLLRCRPTIDPFAVPVWLMGGNKPQTRKRRKINKNLKGAQAPTCKTATADNIFNDVQAILCNCNPVTSTKVGIPFESYVSRIKNLNLPGLKWKIFAFEKKICVTYVTKRKGQFQADKVLALEAGRNPLILFNGVQNQEISSDVDFADLLSEMDNIKSCHGANKSGFCTGINRTDSRYCLPCQLEDLGDAYV